MATSASLSKNLIRSARKFLRSEEPLILAETPQGRSLFAKVIGNLNEALEEAQLPDVLNKKFGKSLKPKSKDESSSFGNVLKIGLIGLAVTGFVALLVGGIKTAFEKWKDWSKDITFEDLEKVKVSAQEGGKDVDRAQLNAIKESSDEVYNRMKSEIIASRAAKIQQETGVAPPVAQAQAAKEFVEYEKPETVKQAVTSPIAREIEERGGVSVMAQEQGLISPSQTIEESAPSRSVKTTSASAEVQEALAFASKTVGVPLSILYAMAHKESSLGKNLSASTSSAKGLFQFIESTWRDMVKKYGRRVSGYNFGLNDRMKMGPSALAGAFYIQENIDILKRKGISRIGATEVYLAHFMGPGGAAAVLNLIKSGRGSEVAANHFRAQAKANKSIFYQGGNLSVPRSLQQVYDFLSGSMESLTEKYAQRLSDTGTTVAAAETSYNRYTDKTAKQLKVAAYSTKESAESKETSFQTKGAASKQKNRNTKQASIDPSTGYPIVTVQEAFS